MCAEYPMHNIASLSSLPTVSSPSLSVPVHAWISRLCLAIELRPTPSCPIHLHSSSSSFLPSFVRIQAQKPMSENNESMMRTEKRELFRILSRNEKVFNFQCLCTKEWNTSWQDVGEIRYIESGCLLSTRFGRVTRPERRGEERRGDVVILLRTLPTSSGSRHVQAGSSRWIVLLSYNRGQRPDTGRILSAGPRFTPLLCHSVCRETRNKRLE